MITHKLALYCAEILATYCNEHWKTGECHECIFQKGKTLKGCQLKVFVGICGEELKKEAEISVMTQCERLSNAQND